MNTRAQCRFKLTVTTGRSAVRNLAGPKPAKGIGWKIVVVNSRTELRLRRYEHHAAEAESLERSVSSRTTRWPRIGQPVKEKHEVSQIVGVSGVGPRLHLQQHPGRLL